MARDLEKTWVQWLGHANDRRPDALALTRRLDPLMNTLLAALRAAAQAD